MLNYVVYTCRLHVGDMFDEMYIMASRGLVKVLFNLLFFHHCFHVLLLLLIFHPGDVGIELDKLVPRH